MHHIFVALDYPNKVKAKELLQQLEGIPFAVKIGLELFASGEGVELVQELVAQKKCVFADWKLHDIPATVARTTTIIAEQGANFLTVHAQESSLKAAVDNAGNTDILAITLLTSVGEDELRGGGITMTPTQYIVEKAKMAIDVGCAGVVCSPLEAAHIRKAVGSKPVIITPGISTGRTETGGHARSAGVKEAISNGASHLVIGRAIRDAKDPKEALIKILAELNQSD